MKMLILGDLHITDKRPKRRIDNYWESFVNKLNFIFNTAQKHDVKLIIQPGDFFDSHKANDFLKSFMIDWILHYGIQFLTIYGQHDLRYHSSDLNNTPLNVLRSAGAVDILDKNVLYIHGEEEMIGFYGASWYEDIPEPDPNNKFNVLVMHKMISDTKLPYEYTSSSKFLKTYSQYDLVISGDNHKSIIQVLRLNKNLKTLINCGSLMRSAVDQIDHDPCVVLYDTKGLNESVTGFFKRINIPVEPIGEVFDMDKVEEDKEKNEKLEEFVASLQSKVKLKGINFAKNLDAYLKENVDKIDLGTIDIIKEALRDH